MVFLKKIATFMDFKNIEPDQSIMISLLENNQLFRMAVDKTFKKYSKKST